MMVHDADLESFRQLVSARMGLSFGDDKHGLLRDIFDQGLAKEGFASAGEYLRALEPLAGKPWDHLSEALTVGETYFFRQWDHFRAVGEAVLPVRIRARAHERRLRILSAGCSSGEEAYSLAMLLTEKFPELEDWQVELKGVDINAASLIKAARGLYSHWSLRETPPELCRRFFQPMNKDFRLDEKVRRKVTFERRNLSTPNMDLWPPAHYDFIFCRNMLMYLTPECAAGLLKRMADALVPGGFLFLGYAESLRGQAGAFDSCQSHETLYYQSLQGKAGSLPSASVATDWVADIQRSTDRIALLTAQVPTAPLAPQPTYDQLPAEPSDD